MELKRVEMLGFKSFPEKVVIEFDKGITAIVGPNGSGKSNIADAVRWVLGEQNARQLRGSKMEDVIFAGTERRKPLNFAQVTLVLSNDDRKMPIDYDEVAISRKVFRSGESEYSINGSRCKLKNVQEILMDTGIGKEGYSIIGQGQVGRLLSDKAQDRRLIFEEAAGIVKFKSRKEEAEKKLEAEESNLNRVSDILTEQSARIEPLTAEAAKAEEYLKVKEELKTYEITAFLGQYKQFNEQYKKTEGDLANLTEQIGSVKERETGAKEKAEALKLEAEAAQEEAKNLSDSHHSLEITLGQKEGERALKDAQLAQKKTDEDASTRQLDAAKEKMHGALTIIAREQANAESLEEKLAGKEEERKAAADAWSALEASQKELRIKWDEAVEAADAARNEAENVRSQGARMDAALEYEKNQQENADQKVQTLTADADAALKTEAEAKKVFLDADKAFAALGDELSGLGSKISDMRERIRGEQARMGEKVEELRETQNRLKWLSDLEKEYEGFSGSVKTLMQLKAADSARYAKVRGTLADLITVPEGLAVALEIALGASIQNIVTDDTATARSLIEYLRREQKGRATFMPMDQVNAREAVREAKQIKAMPGVLGLADELVGYKKEYKNIISRQLGNVVVTEDFDSATEVAHRYGANLRVVTLKGDIFNIGGSITGGSTMKAGNILSRKGEMDTLSGKIAAMQAETDAFQKKIDAMTAERRAMTARLDEVSVSYEDSRQAANQLKMDWNAAAIRREELENQLAAAKETLEAAARSQQEHEEWLSGYSGKLAGAEENEKRAGRMAADAQAAYEARVEEVTAARAAEMNIRIEAKGIEQELEYLRRSIEREQNDNAALAEEAEQFLTVINEARDAQAALTAEIQTLDNEMTDIRAQIETAGAQAGDMERIRKEKTRRWEQSMTAMNDIAAELSALEKEQLRLENQKSRSQKDLQDLQDRIWEDYQLTYNAALSMERTDLGSATAMKRRIGELKESIRAMGPVNVGAIAELVAVTERVELLSTQRDDILATEEKLREIIDQMKTQMEKQFSSSIKKVSALFEETFRKLFGGGHALLRLTEGDDSLEAGVEIIAQPPGKALQSMNLLSGGERALTAIALLFAIQQSSPAPFCILDEIEAALDEANVSRFANYLDNLTDDTQFIVITHRKGTMEAADTMYGVTMEEKGISKCVSVRFDETK